jgi:tetratricopeptide (TPR) repeat protein
MDIVNRITALLSLLLTLFFLHSFGQPDIATMDIKHPAKYENKPLGAEKAAPKKFTKVRRFEQDNITHYNFYFNANNKLNEMLARAKAQHRDDYTKMISFYNYTLDGTAKDRKELDSIIFKCTAGILVHDLRNDWIDNLYMLIGKSYYFRNMPDSAHITFQFVNYAWSPKEEGGYDKPIGSNANADEGGNAFTISTKEKRNVLQKAFSLPPSRNESFIWLIRTYLAANAMTEAAGLIDILKHDPQFPPRLQTDLNEVQSLWFFKQEMYDSAAFYLQKSLGNAVDKQEVSRWEYLIAQMYERINKIEEAKLYYEKVFQHTYDPVLDVYARLNYIRQNKGNDEIIKHNIDALIKMAKKDQYEEYRDIIYYAIAQIELERNDKPAAELYLLKCAKAAQPNSTQKSKAFLQLGDMAFDQKKYRPAKNYYDSVNVNDPLAVENPAALTDRKKALEKIVVQLNIIERQDSLQRIANMPQNERDAFIKKIVKALRKQQGLKEEEQDNANSPQGFVNNNNNNAPPPSLFANPNDNTEWYFNNESLKSQGYSSFKSKWGNRQNTDNWQVSALASQQQRRIADNKANNENNSNNKTDNAQPPAFTFASLLAKLPLTPEKMKISNDSVEHAMSALGKAYQEGLPDYYAAIDAYEKLLVKYPDTKSFEETLFNLFYCYRKVGDEKNATRILELMKQKFPKGKLTAIATDPASVMYSINAPKVEATKKYEDIYTSFIEGRFEEALAEKKAADSIFGKKFWTPQLLYIESIYFIKERNDSAAKSELNIIIRDFNGTPMAAKAKIFLDVLSRRKQIEDYLTNLKIERAKEDSVVFTANQPATKAADSASKNKNPKEDSLQLSRAKIKAIAISPSSQKTDSSKSSFQDIKLSASQSAKIKMDSTQLFAMRKQMDSLQAVMKKMKGDSAMLARLKKQADSIQLAMQKLKSDSTQLANMPKIKSVFAYAPDKPHNVVLVINKVDPVYVTEARNAFNRYDNESMENRSLTINNMPLNDTTKLVVISGFGNAVAALDYLDKAKKAAPRDIVPWLPAAKYSFIIITDDNLALLKSNIDLPAYLKFLSSYFPGKF